MVAPVIEAWIEILMFRSVQSCSDEYIINLITGSSVWNSMYTIVLDGARNSYLQRLAIHHVYTSLLVKE